MQTKKQGVAQAANGCCLSDGYIDTYKRSIEINKNVARRKDGQLSDLEGAKQNYGYFVDAATTVASGLQASQRWACQQRWAMGSRGIAPVVLLRPEVRDYRSCGLNKKNKSGSQVSS